MNSIQHTTVQRPATPQVLRRDGHVVHAVPPTDSHQTFSRQCYSVLHNRKVYVDGGRTVAQDIFGVWMEDRGKDLLVVRTGGKGSR